MVIYEEYTWEYLFYTSVDIVGKECGQRNSLYGFNNYIHLIILF